MGLLARTQHIAESSLQFTNTSVQPVDAGDLGLVLYVDRQVNGGIRDGSSWANAIPELADALKWVATKKMQFSASRPLSIYIAKGVYKPRYSPIDGDHLGLPDDLRDGAFLLVDHVNLYGGFAPSEGITDLSHNRVLPDKDTTGLSGTVLSGDIAESEDDAGDAYHVVIGAGTVNQAVTAEINGITICRGNANGKGYVVINGNGVQRNCGAGMYNIYSSPTLTDVVFRENTAYAGGGIYNCYSGPTLIRIVIAANTASFGGGLYNRTSSPVLTIVGSTGNTARISGGGIYNFCSSPILTLVNIGENSACFRGGGIYNHSSSPILTLVHIKANTAWHDNEVYYSSFPPMLLAESTIHSSTADARIC